MRALPDDALLEQVLPRCNRSSLQALAGVCRRLRDLVRQTHQLLVLRADDAAAVASWPAPFTARNLRALVLNYHDASIYSNFFDAATGLSGRRLWHVPDLLYPAHTALLKTATEQRWQLSEVALFMISGVHDAIRPGNAALAAQLQLLAALESVTHLQLRCSAPPPAPTLAALAGLTALTSLALHDTSGLGYCVGVPVPLCLTSLTRLRGLALGSVWPADVARHRAWLPESVTALMLRGYGADDLVGSWLPALAQLSQLQSLQLLLGAGGRMASKAEVLLAAALALPGLTELAMLTPLKLQLDVEESQRLASFARLPIAPAAQQLAVLRVDSFAIALHCDEDWRRLASLGCLREAGRLWTVCPPPAGVLMPRVTSLQIMGLIHNGWSLSGTWPSLASLSLLVLLPHAPHTYATAVAACTGLTSLALQFCSQLSGADRSTLAGLGPALPALRALSLSWSESITDAFGLPSLAGFSALEAITLCQAPGHIDFSMDEVRDSHLLAALAPLQRLRSVRLEGLPAPTPAIALGLQALLPALTSLEAACCDALYADCEEEHELVQAALRPGMRLLLQRTSDNRLPIETGWPFPVEHLAPPRYDSFRGTSCKRLMGAALGE